MFKWIALLFLLPTCFCFSYPDSQIPEPDRIAHEIIKETAKILKERHNLRSCGTGMEGKFEYVEIHFQIFKTLSKDEARSILLDCANVFLEKFNSSESIRQFLKPSPFTFKNIGIIIYITDENEHDLYDPELCLAKFSPRGLSYKTTDKKNTFRYKETYEETHEEALALLKQQQKNIANQKSN